MSPITGYRAQGGRITLRKSEGWSDRPPITVSCGRCVACVQEHARQWAVRCMHEAQLHEQNCFVTLTYNDECYPVDGSLSVRDWQLFAKRVRKLVGPFRYLHCGEYGEQSGRAHYHAAIFGQDFHWNRREHGSNRHGDKHYVSPVLDAIWGKGHALIGELTFESAAYVARYALKKYGEKWRQVVDEKTGVVRQRPYTTMSRRPGIGAGWFERFKRDVYPADEVVVNGRPGRVPKAYDRYLEQEDPELFDQVKAARVAAAKLSDRGDGDRAYAREKILEARLSLLDREPGK